MTLKNKLHLTMTTCFGRYLYTDVGFKLKSPYSCNISSSESVGEIDEYENYGILFNRLFETGDLVYDYNDMDDKVFVSGIYVVFERCFIFIWRTNFTNRNSYIQPKKAD